MRRVGATKLGRSLTPAIAGAGLGLRAVLVWAAFHKGRSYDRELVGTARAAARRNALGPRLADFVAIPGAGLEPAYQSPDGGF